MTSELELIRKIEAYLYHEMTEEEIAAFDIQRKLDANLDQKVIEHFEFLKSLKNYGEVNALKLEMDIIHSEMEAIPTSEVLDSSVRIVYLWNKYKRNLAVAASVAILTTLVTLFSTGQFKPDTASSTYSALKRDMESIKKSQNALIRNINSKTTSSKAKNIAPSQFGGTGFALSSNGYLVTNYHVVQGADSIYIQNNKGESFKVQTIYIDPSYDIAIMQIIDPEFKSLGTLPYTFKKSGSELGEDVYTIGYPRDEVVYGKGYLSAETGFGGDSIAYQVSIPVNPGNSGGPLLDSKGNVIGVISGKQTLVDGAAFAIKADYLLKAINNIPQDSLKKKIIINHKNNLASSSRTQQIKKMQDYIFMVKVYN
jgi:serine protease Do